MIQIEPVMRVSDTHGMGHFGAPRGSRVHMGVDYAVLPDSWVLSPVCGEVSKLGVVYSEHPEFRYVEVTDHKYKDRLRFFYVYPMGVAVGKVVLAGQRIGYVQDLEELYPGITPHVHFEVMTFEGKYMKPEEYLNGTRIIV